MRSIDAGIHARAAALAEELAAGVRAGRPAEWAERVVGGALLDAVHQERERCAAIAERRVEMWESSARRMSPGQVPAEALTEARGYKEAVVIADAIRA